MQNICWNAVNIIVGCIPLVLLWAGILSLAALTLDDFDPDVSGWWTKPPPPTSGC